MIDLHSHILPFLDDGAKDMEAAIKMLRIAEKDGIRHIIATPHYIEGSYGNNSEKVKSMCDKVEKEICEAGFDIKLYPGNEVFICPELPQLVDSGEICTLNNSRYILMEFPMGSLPQYTYEVIYQLGLRGYVPVIAHPERNLIISQKPNILCDFILKGALVQVNSSSIKGLYGKKTARLALKLIKHNMVHFISSDAHTCRGRSPKLSSARKIVENDIGAEAAERLFELNGLAVLANDEIDCPAPGMIKSWKDILNPFIYWKRFGNQEDQREML